MLVQEIPSNKLAMTLEEHILACFKPWVCGSVELLLQALGADQLGQAERRPFCLS